MTWRTNLARKEWTGLQVSQESMSLVVENAGRVVNWIHKWICCKNSLMHVLLLPPANEEPYHAPLFRTPGRSCWTVGLFFFFLFKHKVSGVHLTGRKPSRPQIILLPSQGLFIISALLHTIPLLLDILPTVISVLARTLFSCFLLLSSLRCVLLPISCWASPWRIPKGVGNNQATLPPSQKNRPRSLVINRLLLSPSQLKS